MSRVASPGWDGVINWPCQVPVATIRLGFGTACPGVPNSPAGWPHPAPASIHGAGAGLIPSTAGTPGVAGRRLLLRARGAEGWETLTWRALEILLGARVSPGAESEPPSTPLSPSLCHLGPWARRGRLSTAGD